MRNSSLKILKSRFAAIMGVLVGLSQTVPAFASSLPSTNNLNLSSTHKTVVAPAGMTPVDIHVGTTTQLVSAGTLLTPAEAAAVTQLLTTGTQSLVIGRLGNATGRIHSQSINGVVITDGSPRCQHRTRLCRQLRIHIDRRSHQLRQFLRSFQQPGDKHGCYQRT